MRNFPLHEVNQQQSVLCLFCAAFGGENDVEHLYNAGFKNVTMVDINIAMLRGMNTRFGYPYIFTDAYKFIDEQAKLNKKYDVVICDQWSSDDHTINDLYFMKLRAITNNTLIVSISKPYIDKHGKLPGIYYKRSDHKGGVFWRVVKID